MERETKNSFENFANPTSIIWQEVETDYWQNFLKDNLNNFIKKVDEELKKSGK